MIQRALVLLLCALCWSPARAGDLAPGARTASDAAADGWPASSRAPWVPLTDDVRDLLERGTPLTPYLDGAFGASLLLLHQPGDAPHARFERDGTGLWLDHAWADDPWTVSLAGVRLESATSREGAPRLDFRTVAADTAGPVLDSDFYKGDDDTYLRRLSFRTPRAPWEYGLHFGEIIDQLPEDRTGTGEHEAKRRSLRLAVRRRVGPGRWLDVDFERVRKHKSRLPGSTAERQEHFGERASLVWHANGLNAALRSQGADVIRVTGSAERKLEVGREELRLSREAAGRGPGLELRLATWRLNDSGAGAWAAADSGAVYAEGEDVRLLVTRPWRLGGSRITGRLGAGWHGTAGWSPELGVRATSGAWHLDVGRLGRAPRLDELFTAERFLGERTWGVLPNAVLAWERRLQVASGWSTDILGWRVDLEGAWRQIVDGIGWTALAGEESVGRRTNDVELTGWSADLAVARCFRLGGLLRLEGRSTLRGVDVTAGSPLALPPARSMVLNVFWERHMFREDGILEIGYVLEHRGAGDDPWLPEPAGELPARTLHHLLVDFRLVGVELGVEVRNLTNVVDPVSARGLELGLEKRWRLSWTLLH